MEPIKFPSPPMLFIDGGGCIVGECPICGDPIHETEWKITGEIMHHEDCEVNGYIRWFAKLPIEKQREIMQGIERV